MSLQMEQAIPDGFVLEKTQNIMRGTYRGINAKYQQLSSWL